MTYILHCDVEVAEADSVEQARHALDTFREAVLPSVNYGVTISESKDDSYARVAWTIGDVQTLRPNMTEDDASDFLANNVHHIQDAMVRAGWDAIEQLLAEDNL